MGLFRQDERTVPVSYDPVGAVAVHCVNGIWGTVAVGLFACNEAYGTKGLFYGGGFRQLGVQCLGVLTVGTYTVLCMILVFRMIRATVGLRASAEEEIEGLDVTEHGLTSAYADFLPIESALGVHSDGPVDTSGLAPFPLELSSGLKETPIGKKRYTLVRILCDEERFGTLRDTMASIGVTGMTVTNVMGYGTQKGKAGQYRGIEMSMHLIPKLQVDIVVSKVDMTWRTLSVFEPENPATTPCKLPVSDLRRCLLPAEGRLMRVTAAKRCHSCISCAVLRHGRSFPE